MSSANREHLVTAAVLFGTVVLFGLPTYALVVSAVETLGAVALFGLSAHVPIETPFSSVGSAPVLAIASFGVRLVALVVAYVVVIELTRVRLHGIVELHRGTRARRLGRHLALAVAPLSALVVAFEFVATAAGWGLENGDATILGFVAAIVLALAWASRRAIDAFVRGYRESV